MVQERFGLKEAHLQKVMALEVEDNRSGNHRGSTHPLLRSCPARPRPNRYDDPHQQNLRA
ncbi:hypothetical protein HHE014_03640 [Helicobacter heilmannii]|nr:hypothetical protein HHE014_03640 [Helicobacter heilmannii]